MEQTDRKRFFDAVSRYEANSPFLARFDIYFRVEDKADVRFWEQLLLPSVKELKIKFIPFVNNDGKKITGKSHILKSIDAAGPQYILCVDSDFDYLLDKEGLCAENYILQTYTYSWENHYCRKEPLNEKWKEYSNSVAIDFDFIDFIKKLNEVIYDPLILLLLLRHDGKIEGTRRPTLTEMCNAFSKIQPNSPDMLKNNGEKIVAVLKQNLAELFNVVSDCYTEDEIIAFKNTMRRKGLYVDTAHLYMQGHAVYDLVERTGRALYGISYEQQILQQTFDKKQKYPELDMIKKDIFVISKDWRRIRKPFKVT